MPYILTVIAVIAASAAVVFGQSKLTKKDGPFWGLLIPSAVFIVNILTLIIMLVSDARLRDTVLVFTAIYLVVVAGVVSYIIFRVQHLGRVADDTRRRNRALAARRAEAESQKRLLALLKGFVCSESSINADGQREIVLMSKAGREIEEIAEAASADVKEIEAILASFKRYTSRIESDDGATDLILTAAQQEEIVSNIANSLPADHGINSESYWTKSTVRSLASDILGTSVSSRIIGAYLRHWDLAVPASKTIKARRENPIVANWLATEFEDIRSKCMSEGGEILWIYTVKPEAIHDVSSNVPKDCVLLLAITNDGFTKFRLYSASESSIFEKFVDTITEYASCKYFAVVNENYDDYMKELGRAKVRSLSTQIEFFRAK